MEEYLKSLGFNFWDTDKHPLSMDAFIIFVEEEDSDTFYEASRDTILYHSAKDSTYNELINDKYVDEFFYTCCGDVISGDEYRCPTCKEGVR